MFAISEFLPSEFQFPVVTTGPRWCRPSTAINMIFTHLGFACPDGLIVVQGGARGSDTHVHAACSALGIPCQTEHADWSGPCDLGSTMCQQGHRRKRRGGGTYCPSAGIRRNQFMLDKWQPKLGMSVIDRPIGETRGTKDCVERMAAAGVAYVELDIRRPIRELIDEINVCMEGLAA